MDGLKKVIPILFFPITVYLAIGTALLMLTTQIDKVVENLGNFSRFPFLDIYTATEWHKKSPWFTAGFPILWPVLFVYLVLLLFYAIIAAIIRTIINIL